MAEINFNNLYNQLKPMEKRFYDQQFQKKYNPNQENIMLSSQPAYEQMKAVYDAQQQVPEESFLDKINIFGSASAAEMPQVPNLTYKNIDLPFDLNTGVTNTTQAAPFLKSMADIAASGNVNTDLVNQLIEENQKKRDEVAENFYKDLFEGHYLPGGRVIAGAGDLFRLKTLANCFVSTISEDSLEGIFKTAYEAARTYSFGANITF